MNTEQTFEVDSGTSRQLCDERHLGLQLIPRWFPGLVVFYDDLLHFSWGLRRRSSYCRSVQRFDDIGYVLDCDFMKNTESAEPALPAMVVNNLDVVEVAQAPG